MPATAFPVPEGGVLLRAHRFRRTLSHTQHWWTEQDTHQWKDRDDRRLSDAAASQLLHARIVAEPALASHVTSLSQNLLHLHQVAQWVLCHVLFSLISLVTMCFCVGLLSIFPIRLPAPTLPLTLKEPD